MHLEILYFPGCPNQAPAIACLREALQQEGVPAVWTEVVVEDEEMAYRVGFLGSPTIRVDGQDVELSARSSREYGLGCRTYCDEGMRTGLPPLDWIRSAVREAKSRQVLKSEELALPILRH